MDSIDVELLKDQGLEGAGEIDGLQAYAVLLCAQGTAEALDVPLAEIGLDGFDLDQLLKKPPPKQA